MWGRCDKCVLYTFYKNGVCVVCVVHTWGKFGLKGTKRQQSGQMSQNIQN